MQMFHSCAEHGGKMCGALVCPWAAPPDREVLMTRVWREDLAVQQVKFHSGARCNILRKEKQDRHRPGPNNATLNMHPLSKCLHKHGLQMACEFTQRNVWLCKHNRILFISFIKDSCISLQTGAICYQWILFSLFNLLLNFSYMFYFMHYVLDFNLFSY